MVGQWYYQNAQYAVEKKSIFINNQKAKGLLNNLGIKTTLIKVPILGDIFF